MTRRRLQLWLGAALVALALGAATPAGAHADLRVSCPGVGEVLSSTGELTLGFDGPMLLLPEAPARIILTDAAGDERELDPVLSAQTVFVAQMGELPAGRYGLSYELLSFDGDLNIGSFDFEIAPNGAPVCALFEAPSVSGDDGGGATGVVIAVVAGAVGMTALAGFVVWRSRRPDEPGEAARG